MYLRKIFVFLMKQQIFLLQCATSFEGLCGKSVKFILTYCIQIERLCLISDKLPTVYTVVVTENIAGTVGKPQLATHNTYVCIRFSQSTCLICL